MPSILSQREIDALLSALPVEETAPGASSDLAKVGKPVKTYDFRHPEKFSRDQLRTLEDEVKEVRLSARLTTSPACIVVDANDVTPALARMYRAMGQDMPHVKRILELNPEHLLVTGLRQAHQERPDDSSLAETVELLFGTAVLAEGGELADPARFARLLADRLERTL